MNKKKFKDALGEKTGCYIQHNGWCCGTCFYNISPKTLSNHDWRCLLFYRGDYTKKELEIEGQNHMKSINKIWELIK